LTFKEKEIIIKKKKILLYAYNLFVVEANGKIIIKNKSVNSPYIGKMSHIILKMLSSIETDKINI